MAQKQMRVDENVYHELEDIAKHRHCSVAEAGNWVLRFKLDTVQLADAKPGTKESAAATEKLADEYFNLGYQRGILSAGIKQVHDQLPELNKKVDEYIARKQQQAKPKPVWPHS